MDFKNYMKSNKNNQSPVLKTHKNLAIMLLILTNVLWGTSFILTKTITQDVPIFFYLGLRHLIAVLGFLPCFINIRKFNKQIVIMGSISGLLYFLTVVTQAFGLQTTTAGKAGFITGLGTILVPFIMWLGFKKPLKKRIWLAAALAIGGMGLLSLEGESGILIGDFLVLSCAIFYAFYIVYNDKNVNLVDIYPYTIVQLAFISSLCFISSIFFNESYDILSIDIGFVLIIFYMGIGVSTLTFLFQNYGQQHVKPSKTAIIFTLEPVFAALFGFLLGNEIMSLFGWIGCGVIFIAILVTVLKNEEIIEHS